MIVSRGQAVEIGGRFRIPDVLAQSGAVLVEVGTTNRTYLSDYEAACTESTALLLRVHHSNFRMTGFVAETGITEMVALGRRRSVPVLNDLGSGCLVDTTALRLDHEPTVQESVAAGADITVFSGDKLLGGPQSGLVVGRRDLVERIRRHPLARALRCDKVTLAALHATLLHYLRGEALEKVPVLMMLARRQEDVMAQASRWKEVLPLPGAHVAPSLATVGGGALPGSTIPSAALVIDPTNWPLSVDALAARLRAASPPVVARVEDDRVWLDPRTVQPEEESALVRTVRSVLA